MPIARPTPSAPARILAGSLLIAALWLVVSAAGLVGVARASAATRTVTFDGVSVTVPRAWPVIHLARDPQACVRFDRHALYLGAPGRSPSCAQRGAGRSEALWLEPATRQPGPLPVSRRAADAPQGTALELVRGHVRIIATWDHDPALIERVLGTRSIASLAAASRTPPPAASLSRDRRASATVRTARAAAATPGPVSPAATPGEVYTGEGFDACSTPSTSTMSAWSSSPYRAIGIYIGGANMACSQPNLTADWVSQESAAGWHLVPIYVGLQAPTNSCGCAAISPSSAAAEGSAAAADAVTQAQAVGLGAGNPLYFDMEGYSRNSTNTSAVLAFLQAWTQSLHSSGYLSGVYSSDNSGIVDLVSQYGTTYTEPDEIWFANWNNEATTTDANIPAGDWASHQRLHQYSGGHNETYGGDRINIDSDYLDAATAAGGAGTGTAPPPPPPAASKPPTISGAAIVGQTLTETHGHWSGAPTSYSLQWLDCDPSGANCAPIAGATNSTYTVTSSDTGHRIRVLEAATGPGGTGQPSSSAPTATTLSTPTSGYWLLSAFGNVFHSPGASFLGSAVRRRLTDISSIGSTRSGRGYWLATRAGQVFAFGNASSAPPPPPAPRGVIGIAGDPAARGYWLATSGGRVVAVRSPFFGSPAAAHLHPGPVVGLAVAAGGHGYWVAMASGHVFAYGAAAHLPAPGRRHRVRGIVAEPHSRGYWLFTAQGDVYDVDSRFYGSPAAAGVPVSNVVGMASTPDGNGYWLVTSSGQTFAYGDAATFSLPRMPHPVTGIAGS